MFADYYLKVLYPLQDKVVEVFRETPFYLTGGTALPRGYYNHRYSDDMDYFANDMPSAEFQKLVARQIKKLQAVVPPVDVEYQGEDFFRLYVGKERMKIEIVNDVPSHVGSLLSHPLLGIIDSKENILANKITAVCRKT